MHLTQTDRLVCNGGMKRNLQKNPDRAQKSLLASAFREMHLNGFQGASVGNILAETGLTKGALYHHFHTKQALGLAVVDAFIRPKFTPLFEALAGENGLDALIPTFSEWVRRMDADMVRRGCPLNNLLNEMSPLDPQFNAKLLSLTNEFRSAVEAALVRSQNTGVLRPSVNCRDAASFIVSAWQGSTGIAKLEQSKRPLLACIAQLEEYINLLKTEERITPPPLPAKKDEKGDPPRRQVSMDWD